MKSKKQFFMGIALVLTFAILVGLVLPWLMSAKSTIAVLIALAIIVCIVAGLVYVGMFKLLKDEK
jgi:NADH:ubiquinone oxidoreductase subunit 3 (subunit A)